jgi:hypothetical protein
VIISQSKFTSAACWKSIHQSNGWPFSVASHSCTVDMPAMCPREKMATAGTCTRNARHRPRHSNRKCCESQTIAGVKSAQRYQ